MAGDTLRKCVNRIRRRIWVFGGVAGIAWGVTAAAVLLLAAMWLDLLWELSPQLRIGAGAAALAAGPVVLVGIAWLAAAHSRARSVARRMDMAANTGGAILSGWDLAHGPEWPSPLSAGLAELAVSHASQSAAAVPAGRVAPLKLCRRSLGSLVLVSAAVGGLALVMPDLARNQWRRFTSPFADLPPYSRVSFVVEPGDTEVVYGRGLDVYATVEGAPVDRVEMVLVIPTGQVEEGNQPAEEQTIVPMFPEAGGRWRAVLASVTQESTYFVRSREARSQRYRIGVITVPQITGVRFRVVPPEYTRQPAYEGPLPQGGIFGLRGTRVTAWAASNRPLSGGLLKLTTEAGEQELTMDTVSSGEVAASFDIERGGKLELWVVDEAGQRSRESFVAGVTLLEDQHPLVRIVEPRATSLATPNVTLPILLAAEDDYGISRLELFRSLNDSRPMPMEVPLPQSHLRRWNEAVPLPLGLYGLEPGDVIKLFARVEDNDPAGAKGSESSVVTIQIISQQQYERMMRMRQGLEMLMSKYRQAQRRLESQAEKKKGLQKKSQQQGDKPLDDEMRKALEELAAQIGADAAALRQAAGSPMPFDVDKNFAKHLEKLAQAMEENQRRLQRLTELSKQSKLSSRELAEALGQMLKEGGGSQLEFEQSAMLPLETLEKVMPLIANQSKFVDLYRRQRDLAERLASLKGRDNEDNPELKARMRDLEVEQRTIREALDRLLTDIDERADRLPEDARFEELRRSAKELVKAVRESGAIEAMSDAEGGLAEFSGTRGHAKAKEAADILEKFLNKCEGMGGAGSQCLIFAPGLGQGLGNTIAQMLAEMGLGMGMGMGDGAGQGSGSGYSSRTTTAENTGLYGNQPLIDGASQGGGSRDSKQAGPGGQFAHRPDGPPGTMVDSRGPMGTGSGAEGLVPPHYRRRVSDYFRRIGEETGK